MLGSHNSMSYLKPIHWWQRWQKPWYQCQELNLVQQFSQGARYFDIRVNLVNGEWHYVHNKIDFGHIQGFVALDTLIELAKQGNRKIYFRFILDRREEPQTEEEKNNLYDEFNKLITWFESFHTQNKSYYAIDETIIYWNWYILILNKDIQLNVEEYHNSVVNKGFKRFFKYLLGNKHFAKKRNKIANTFHEKMIVGNQDVLLLDFINVK